MSLFSVGLQENGRRNNLKEIQTPDFYPHVQNIILNTQAKNIRYLYLLRAINAMVVASSTAADYFMERVFSEVKNEISITYNDYKKDFGLTSSTLNQTENAQELSNRIFAGQICLIGSLLNSREDKRRKVFSDEPNNPVWHVIGIINHSKADPLVLTSVCYLVH